MGFCGLVVSFFLFFLSCLCFTFVYLWGVVFVYFRGKEGFFAFFFFGLAVLFALGLAFK